MDQCFLRSYSALCSWVSQRPPMNKKEFLGSSHSKTIFKNWFVIISELACVSSVLMEIIWTQYKQRPFLVRFRLFLMLNRYRKPQGKIKTTTRSCKYWVYIPKNVLQGRLRNTLHLQGQKRNSNTPGNLTSKEADKGQRSFQ